MALATRPAVGSSCGHSLPFYSAWGTLRVPLLRQAGAAPPAPDTQEIVMPNRAPAALPAHVLGRQLWSVRSGAYTLQSVNGRVSDDEGGRGWLGFTKQSVGFCKGCLCPDVVLPSSAVLGDRYGYGCMYVRVFLLTTDTSWRLRFTYAWCFWRSSSWRQRRLSAIISERLHAPPTKQLFQSHFSLTMDDHWTLSFARSCQVLKVRVALRVHRVHCYTRMLLPRSFLSRNRHEPRAPRACACAGRCGGGARDPLIADDRRVLRFWILYFSSSVDPCTSRVHRSDASATALRAFPTRSAAVNFVFDVEHVTY